MDEIGADHVILCEPVQEQSKRQKAAAPVEQQSHEGERRADAHSAMRVATDAEICRIALPEDALHLALRRGLHRSHDLIVRGTLLDAGRQVHD